jgi:hypothetical protein
MLGVGDPGSGAPAGSGRSRSASGSLSSTLPLPSACRTRAAVRLCDRCERAPLRDRRPCALPLGRPSLWRREALGSPRNSAAARWPRSPARVASTSRRDPRLQRASDRDLCTSGDLPASLDSMWATSEFELTNFRKELERVKQAGGDHALLVAKLRRNASPNPSSRLPTSAGVNGRRVAPAEVDVRVAATGAMGRAAVAREAVVEDHAEWTTRCSSQPTPHTTRRGHPRRRRCRSGANGRSRGRATGQPRSAASSTAGRSGRPQCRRTPRRRASQSRRPCSRPGIIL